MPGFDKDDFPFCVTHVSPTFNLINVKDVTIGELIKSVREVHYQGQQAAVLKSDCIDPADKDYPYPISMHFATKPNSIDGKKRIESWHCKTFKSDFKQMLS